MGIKLDHKGKEIFLPNRFHEFNFNQALEIYNLEVPKEVIKHWEGEEFRLNQNVADYYNKCLSILSGKDLDLNFYSLTKLLTYRFLNLTNILYSINKINPYEVVEVKSFKFNNTKYSIIKDREIINDIEPLYYIKAIEIINGLNALNGGFEAIIAIVALLYKKDDTFTEEEVINKAEDFKKLSMDKVFYALHRFNIFLDYINTRFDAIGKKIKTDPKAEFAYKNSGLANLGYIIWRDEVAKKYSYKHKDVEQMNGYDFLEIYNLIRAEQNNIMLMH